MDRLLRALSIAIVIFATIVAFVVGSRIDQNTISLLSGTMIGILIATPGAAIITFVLLRRRENNAASGYDRSLRHSAPLPQNPPQYWVLPQTMQPMRAGAYPVNAIPAGITAMGWPMAPGMGGEEMNYLPRPRRKFYVIGENGEPKALDDPATDDDPYAIDSDGPGAAF
jgi:hypothetical protein